MITLSSNMSTAVGSVSTLPCYLVEVQFPSGTVYWTNGPTVTYNSYTWLSKDLEITGLSNDSFTSTGGRLTLGVDSEQPQEVASLVLDSVLTGFSGRRIKVWYYDYSLVRGGALSEALLLFDGVGDSTTLNPIKAEVSLVNTGLTNQYLPRFRINKQKGFNYLQPRGTRVLGIMRYLYWSNICQHILPSDRNSLR